MTGDFVASMARTNENKTTGTAMMHIIKNRFGNDGMDFPCNFNADCGKLEMFSASSVEGIAVSNKIKGKNEMMKDSARKKFKKLHGGDGE